MGRSRGGLTTKIHAVVDALGLPIKLTLSEGQAYDGHQAKALLGDLPPRAMVLADRAYDADAIRRLVADQDAWANIPSNAATPLQTGLLEVPLQDAQPRRAFLQQTQTFPGRRNPVRQRPGELSRRRQTRLNPHLVAV
jgi:transposase